MHKNPCTQHISMSSFLYRNYIKMLGKACTCRVHRLKKSVHPVTKLCTPGAGYTLNFNTEQCTHCTGKSGKMATKIHTGNTQGIWFAQVVNSLILEVKDISIFAVKISNFLLKLDQSAMSVLCML